MSQIHFGLVQILQKTLFKDENILNLYQGKLKGFSDRLISTVKLVAGVLSCALLALLREVNVIADAMQKVLDRLQELKESANEALDEDEEQEILDYADRVKAFTKKSRFKRDEVIELLEEGLSYLIEE